MATGGRVLHHLRNRLDDKRTTVLLVGFQAAGTRGRALQEGAKQLRMFGQEVKVRAKVERLDGLSAHADREEIFRWLQGFEHPPRQTFLVHGEPGVAHSLAEAMATRLRWKARPAEDRETVEIH
jgi:metallo-beta-lactamase family protein